MAKIKTLKDFTATELKLMPRSARPIGFEELSPDQIAKKYYGRSKADKAKIKKART